MGGEGGDDSALLRLAVRAHTELMTNYLQSTTKVQRVIFVVYAIALIGGVVALIWRTIPWWPFGIVLVLGVIANMFFNPVNRGRNPQENDPNRR